MDGRQLRWVAWEIVRSPTYIQLLDFKGEWLARSLTMIKKNMGRSLVPCGMPADMEAQLEVERPTLTNCFRPDRKLHIEGIKDLYEWLDCERDPWFVRIMEHSTNKSIADVSVDVKELVRSPTRGGRSANQLTRQIQRPKASSPDCGKYKVRK